MQVLFSKETSRADDPHAGSFGGESAGAAFCRPWSEATGKECLDSRLVADEGASRVQNTTLRIEEIAALVRSGHRRPGDVTETTLRNVVRELTSLDAPDSEERKMALLGQGGVSVTNG